MTTIYAYNKVLTDYTIIQMMLPSQHDIDSTQHCAELCTLGGVTYVAVPDGVVLPDQPPELTLSTPQITPELRDAIKLASPHVQLISQRMIDTIRARYSIDDEMYFARIGVGAATGMYAPGGDELQAMAEFGAFVESVREWGRAEKVKLGL